MNTVLSRANALFAFTLSVLATLTSLLFLSTVLNEYKQKVNIDTVKVLVKNLPDYNVQHQKNDLGYLTFNIEADLQPLFNWNTKQLFMYLTAEYQTPANSFNQVVLWDKIVLRGQKPVINLKDLMPKYYFWDDGNGLRDNKNVTLTLSWNVIPNAGYLPNALASGSHQFRFPNEYTTTRV